MDISNTNGTDAVPSIADEIAAAEAELRAAQEKLDAAKAKASLADASKESSETTEEPPAPQTASESTVVEATVVASAPIELDAEPVAAPEVPDPNPNWVSYTASAEQPQPVPQEPPAPYGGDPAHAASGQQAQGGYYWQQPQQNADTQYGYNAQYSQPQTPYEAVPPQQQYYYQQSYAPVVASKDHVAAGLLAIFLGSLGIHKFYLGYNTAGFIMLAVTILGGIITLGIAAAVMGVIAFIEGILYLVKSQSEFEQVYVFNKREWF